MIDYAFGGSLVLTYAICVGFMAAGFFLVRRWWLVAIGTVLLTVLVSVVGMLVVPGLNPGEYWPYAAMAIANQAMLMLFYAGVGALLAVSLARHRRPGRPTPAASDNPDGATT